MCFVELRLWLVKPVVHMCVAVTEGKVSAVGIASKDVNEWEELDMDRGNPLI